MVLEWMVINMRLIDSDKLYVRWSRDATPYFTVCDIENAPTVDAEPVRHGRWIDHGDYITTAYGSLDIKVCSNCNAEVTLDGYDYYCPNCGALMDAEVNDHGSDSTEHVY